MEKIKNFIMGIDRRKYILGVFLGLFFCLGVRLYIIQVHPSKIVQGEMQNFQSEKISLMKYNILDSNNKNMINFNKKYIMVLDTKPFSLNNYEETIEDLMALNFIMQSEDPTFSYSNLMANEGKHYFEVNEDTYNKIRVLKDIKGIYTYVYDVADKSKAWEPENFLAEIDEKNIVEGSIQEEIYSHIKDNKFPMLSFYLDDRAVYSNEKLDLGENNKNVKLTIDSELQEQIRKILLNSKYDHLNNIGVTLIESKTGKVKAMVQKDETQANINLGIGIAGFEPGSIFKVIPEAVALEEGAIQMQTTFTCNGNVCLRNNKQYAHGTLTVQQALNLSCNEVFGKIGATVGYDKLMEYCDKIGLFQRVINFRGAGIDEAIGSKPKESDGMTNISMGQCTMATPIQMVGAVNTIINNGTYVKPYIIDSFIDNNDNIVDTFSSKESNVFSETTSKLVKENMKSTLRDGTGVEAYVDGVEVGGKTGSSTGVNNITHGWFIGYCVIGEETYTMAIVAPNLAEKGPNGELLGGGNTAGAVFADIVKMLKNK